MSIGYAILGFLSWRPSTGYELKKIFEGSSAMYWSGNNNQIYKSLVQLLDDGLVTSETEHREGSPTRKTYTITDKGLLELKEWVLSAPEPPDFRKTFLVQLAWADMLDNGELSGLLSKYENEVKLQLLLQQEKLRRGLDSPQRSPREEFLWKMIYENLISSYRNELDWIREVRDGLFEKDMQEARDSMDFNVNEVNGKKYIELTKAANPLKTVQDALDLAGLCGGNDTNLLMLHAGALSEGFFRLKTGIAGDMLQKFVNYHVKVAFVTPDLEIYRGKFAEMAAEANKGVQYGFFYTRGEAESWLVK